MKRAVDLTEISDGRLYRSNDLVKLDTCGCEGCCACCKEMEETIVLDPYDIWRLQAKAGIPFDLMLARHARLTVIDGLVLPVLTMTDKGSGETCTFLNEQGRCSIHEARPGICRLFPLGRYYDGGDFRYFLQKDECKKAQAKVRIRKWLDTPDLPRYEDYLRSWHVFTERLMYFLEGAGDTLQKAACVYLLQAFYSCPWKEEQDFYEQYEARLSAAQAHFGFLN